MNNIAIFGGAFNPSHIGHIGVAQALSECDKFDKILIVPTGVHCDKQVTTPFQERYNLAKLAFSGIPKVEIIDIENVYPDCNRTLKLVNKLSEIYPNAKFHITIGSDRLENFSEWYCYQELLKNADIIAVSRHKDDEIVIKRSLENLENTLGKLTYTILTCDDIIDISSTQIRENLARYAKFLTMPVYEECLKLY
jgi:nicotinate-nucleotide adenylyltransferase